MDLTTVEVSPSSRAWERARSAFWDAAIAAGWDVRSGARLLSDLRALELGEIQGDSDSRYVRGGPRNLFAQTFERLRERMIALGAAEDDLNDAQRLLCDPKVSFRAPTISTGLAPSNPLRLATSGAPLGMCERQRAATLATCPHRTTRGGTNGGWTRAPCRCDPVEQEPAPGSRC